MEQRKFLAMVGPLAQADMQKSGILASLTIAQAILESGWGASELATKANALFGIKADARWSGKAYSKDTKECYDGATYTTITALFRAYDSWAESVADHSAFLLANKRYAAVVGERDYKVACKAIKAAGYATDPGYPQKLIGLIEKYGLTVYDGKAEQEDKTSMNISITKKTSTHNTTAAAGRAIRYIVVHYTAGVTSKPGSAAGTASYFIETTILDKDCSPAAVLGFAMIEGKKFKTSLSVPTIYKYIAKGLFLNLTQEELPRHGKKKHKYKKVKKNKSASRAPAGESIEQRPEEIDEREEFGHWEGDTVYSGKGKRKTTRALLTLTERKTRKEIIIAIPNRKAETVVKALDALERKLGARRFRAIFKSITFDNGTEFAAAEELERSCINKHLPRTKVYFCHPYSSWERGTNENTNGMIRRRFPKGTNFAAVTNAQITQAENWINNYPRKILGYKSSEIVFRECLRELGIAA